MDTNWAINDRRLVANSRRLAVSCLARRAGLQSESVMKVEKQNPIVKGAPAHDQRARGTHRTRQWGMLPSALF